MFYQMMSARYANRRTFSVASEGSAGGSEEAGNRSVEVKSGSASAAASTATSAAVAAAAAAAVTEAKPADGPGGDAAAKTASVTEAPKTDDEKAALIREVMEKKGKLKDAEEKLKGFEGVDVAQYRDLIAKETAAEQAAAEAKGDFDRVKTMMAEAHAAEKADLERQLQEARQALGTKDSAINELTIGNDFGNSSFIQKDLILSPAKTRVLYGAHFEVEGGKTVGYDKPRGDATRTMLVDASGNPLPFNDALSKIVNADPDKKSVLRATAKPGAGSTTTTPSGVKEPQKADGHFGVSRIRATLGN